MRIIIESPGLKTDEKLENQIRSKFENLEKIYKRIEKCMVLMKIESDDRNRNCFMEGRLSVPQKTLFAFERAETFEIALKKVIQDLEHQLYRYKEERVETR